MNIIEQDEFKQNVLNFLDEKYQEINNKIIESKNKKHFENAALEIYEIIYGELNSFKQDLFFEVCENYYQ